MKRIVATIATGECSQIYDVTRASMQTYASKLGANHIAVKHTTRNPPHFAKFDLLVDLADQGYEQVLYVDADVYIRKDAPNIFETHTQSAAFNEVPHPKHEWVGKSLDWIQQNLDKDWPRDRYFNTGVLAFDGRSLLALASIISRTRQRDGIYFEQEQLNVLMRDAGCPATALDCRWNQFCGPVWFTPKRAKNAYFLHGTGVPNDKKPSLLLRLSRDYP